MAIVKDPYFTGAVEDKSGPRDKLGSAWTLLLAWLAVYVANLFVPLFFGWITTDSSGKVGMVLGILLVFAPGCRLCFASRRAMLAVVYGGWLVAAFQFVPILHIFAGSIGLRAASVLAKMPDRRIDHVDSVLGGLIATLVTGAILLTIAAILGLVIRGLASAYTRRVAAGSKR